MAEQSEQTKTIQQLRELIQQDSQRDQAAVERLSALHASVRERVESLQNSGAPMIDEFTEILSGIEEVKSFIMPTSPVAQRSPLSAAEARRDAASVEENADDGVADTGVMTDNDVIHGSDNLGVNPNS